MFRIILTALFAMALWLPKADALVRPELEFKIFQFPTNMMPRIDGKIDDWSMVGPEYTYGTDLINDTEDGHGTNIDRKDLDIKVRVGWVKDLNRLYFLYEATDDYWDFARFDGGGYINDIFEIVVDGDISGGPFIFNPQIKENVDNHFRFSGVHAQNYHIFTPPVNNQWCLVWGCQPWVCRFPYANYAYDYNFKAGESGKLVLEFWITPFDYAPYDGPDRAVESKLEENSIIGLSWSILDFDGGKRDGHYNLAHDVNMVKDGSYLPAFRLMPLEEKFQPKLESRWSFKVVDMDRRLVYFKDESIGNITKWTWHFGDGETSNEQYPLHQYKKAGIHYTVWLEVEGPDGKSTHSKHWDVMVK
jgi:hypothetical protein